MEKLAPRETKVLHLISTGLNNSDIAKELLISKSTVKRYVAFLYEKVLGENRKSNYDSCLRAQLVDSAHRNNLLGLKDASSIKTD